MDISKTKTLQECDELGQLVELLISWQFAKKQGRCMATAIKRTAKIIRDKTKSVHVYEACKAILKADNDKRVVAAVVALNNVLERDGLIECVH